MTPMRHSVSLAFTSAAFALVATSALALPITTIDFTAATWTSPTFDGATPSSITGGGDPANIQTIAWGTPGTSVPVSGLQSSYQFTVAGDPLIVDLGVPGNNPFDLGTFVHNNWPITGGALTSVILTLDFSFSIADATGTDTFSPASVAYMFTHLETRNSAPCPVGSVTVCDDVVNIVSISAVDDIIATTAAGTYALIVTGFANSGPLLTAERGVTTDALSALVTFSPSINEIPVPAALPLLASALGVFGFMRHRRKAA
jgi:hypothetical protein